MKQESIAVLNSLQFNLAGDWFILDINRPEKDVNGIIRLETDPSKDDIPPDAYPGTVVQTGPNCHLVWPGDTVVVERWVYSQFSIGQGVICAREVDLLVLDGEVPAPNVLVIHILPEKVKPKIVMPNNAEQYAEDKKRYWFGKVVGSSYYHMDVEGDLEIRRGDFVYVRKMDYQYRIGNHTLLVRIKADCKHQYKNQDIIPLVLHPVDL